MSTERPQSTPTEAVQHDGLRVPRSDEHIIPIVRASTLGWEICKNPDPNAGTSFIIEDIDDHADRSTQ